MTATTAAVTTVAVTRHARWAVWARPGRALEQEPVVWCLSPQALKSTEKARAATVVPLSVAPCHPPVATAVGLAKLRSVVAAFRIKLFSLPCSVPCACRLLRDWSPCGAALGVREDPRFELGELALQRRQVRHRR